ncbi:DUF6517 family protein [Natronococcus sp.]|uniref:DUF6517 family protein n=1 Tax=Natronococcus sp. TaxID=35747 RepID=UPI0025D2909A|nr:DUF6517 family protein [Natronococcus sp.]
MTPSRRSVLAAGAAGGLALGAGCLDVVSGEEPLEFAADRVEPAEATVAETGYESRRSEYESIDRTVGVGLEREVRASIWQSVYSKSQEYEGEDREASLFAAVSTPEMAVAGRSANPLADASNEELLEEILDRVDGAHGEIDGLEHERSFVLEILGAGREVDVFAGDTDLDGERVGVDVLITSFDHEDDFLVAVGTHPTLLVAESANLELLLESLEHPLEE